MDSTNEQPSTSTSTTPASASRTIPIKLTSTPSKIPEVHIKEIPETDEISEISEVSQSICHVIKIRKLNRPTSMYNNPDSKDKKDTKVETKVDEIDSQVQAASKNSNDMILLEAEDEAKTPVPPKDSSPEAKNAQAQVDEESPQSPSAIPLSLEKNESKEATDHIIPEPNMVAIKAQGIITACEGPDGTTSEEVTSIHRNIGFVKESAPPPPQGTGQQKSWINQNRESLNSGSSQFDVSEIPLDIVDIRESNFNSDAFESVNDPHAVAKSDDVNIAIEKASKEQKDEASKPPKSPKAKVSIQVESNTATASKTVVVADDEHKVEPVVEFVSTEAEPQTSATLLEAKVHEEIVESSNDAIEPERIHITQFEVAEAVATKQSNENPIIQEIKKDKASISQESNENIHVTEFKVTTNQQPLLESSESKDNEEKTVTKKLEEKADVEEKVVNVTKDESKVKQEDAKVESGEAIKKIKSDEKVEEKTTTELQSDQIEMPNSSKEEHKADLIPRESLDDKIHVPKDRPRSAASLERESKQMETELPEDALKEEHKADLIPHEDLEDKIHVPKDRPKSAASLEREHKQELKEAVTPQEQLSPNSQITNKDSPNYNPLDDPGHPEYRPIIHQSSFEIPIIFEKKSTGDGDVRTAFNMDELHWENEISEASKSEAIKKATENLLFESAHSETKPEKIEEKSSNAETKSQIVEEIKHVAPKDDAIAQNEKPHAEPWQALEDVQAIEELEPHVLEKIAEFPEGRKTTEEIYQEAKHEKMHEFVQGRTPPPTEPPKHEANVNIHYPMDLEVAHHEAPHTKSPPTTKKAKEDLVITSETKSESSPDNDEETYFSVATHNLNSITQESNKAETKVAKEAAEVQKETEKMISDDESLATSFYSVSEKLSSDNTSRGEYDKEKTPEAKKKDEDAKLKSLTMSQYENQKEAVITDKTSHRRQIPVIIETMPELDGDDIEVTIEETTQEDDEDKPQVTLRKDKQRQISLDDHSKPIVAVAPTSRPSEIERQMDERREKKKEENQVIIGVTRPTSVIRTDEDADSEAPLIRVKRKELEELEDILGEELKVQKHEHKFDEQLIPEGSSSKSPKSLERKPSTPFYDVSTNDEVPIKYRNREAKLIQRLSEQSPTQTDEKLKLNGAQNESIFNKRRTNENEQLSPKQNGVNETTSKKISMTESIIRDLREVNHELTHSPKSPSPNRNDECFSPRTLARFHNPSVVFDKSNEDKIEGGEVIHHHPVFVKDTSKYWYKPTISREEAINMLRDKSAGTFCVRPGTFIIRDSNSFPGAFGLALKVAKPPEGVATGDGTELVRHFLIEPSSKGVKLKGCNNEPVFGTLAALVYQHSITPMALPCRLLLPEYDPASTPEHLNAAQALLEQGAACNVTYVYSFDTESLTGPEAVRRAVHEAMEQYARGMVRAVNVHFKVSSQGITLTDNTRTLFFRRHYPTNSVIFAGIDPEDRKWDNNSVIQLPPTYVRQARVFGFVARKISTKADNACHVFAELDPEQPATAVVNFITKVMMGQQQQQQNQRGRTLPPI